MPQEHELVAHARNELKKLGESDETIDEYAAVIEAFTNIGHLPAVSIPVLVELLNYRNLASLTSDPDEWRQLSDTVWQSTRNPEAFSNDGGKTYKLLSEGYMVHESVEIVKPPVDPSA